MADKLVLFSPKEDEYVAGIGKLNADGSIETVKIFKLWDEVREHADYLLKLGIANIRLGKKLGEYYEQYSESTEVPPSFLEAFDEGGKKDD